MNFLVCYLLQTICTTSSSFMSYMHNVHHILTKKMRQEENMRWSNYNIYIQIIPSTMLNNKAYIFEWCYICTLHICIYFRNYLMPRNLWIEHCDVMLTYETKWNLSVLCNVIVIIIIIVMHSTIRWWLHWRNKFSYSQNSNVNWRHCRTDIHIKIHRPKINGPANGSNPQFYIKKKRTVDFLLFFIML